MVSYNYETLSAKARESNVEIVEKQLRGRNKGFYSDGLILIDTRISTIIEKACILSEELGHHHTSFGDILDQNIIHKRKQELRARQWAYQCLIPLNGIIQAHHARISGRYDLAEYLGVTEEFLQAAIDRYTEKFGLSVQADERHIIYFDPLGVVELKV
ncbi:ImmA/IrrE family metallo-endopeptidase [Paenibacillus polymyxa]|uniref:Domain of uncharacterized function (DUF955) n=2 Tax=Paenibacillus polymyxa TaxID=1406 RepID=A0A378XWQ0_PAEPO|nr:ImmA/IrrE family metallo-endopeptidase [Paenibacillus polymyxa]UOD88750.1 ImmA/IrrE family metallo-endopeptidase [Paenibacillus polymyxa ATCC 842]MBG9763148.1 membrane protein [Paenibacillus polymyxa]MBG9766464.1 membrane protein [Paenibacillus polymyxa]QPK56017.1 ImmA/IrrE family metallo-endopeptidase [Paenibacillus polymyxa]